MKDRVPARLSLQSRSGGVSVGCSAALAAVVLSIPFSALPAFAAPLATPIQDAAPAAPAAPAAAPQATPPAPAPGVRKDVRVRFNFKGQTYDQILDWFSRMTGYPIVREVPVPAGTVDYIYPGEYTLPQALETLNILLQTQSVMLRVEGDRLFLQKLEDMKRENVPTFVGKLPSTVTDDQIVTIVLPLMNARAVPVAEQVKNLIASYGSVTPLEQQNSIIIVETAAQVRRIQSIIAQLDQQDVENIIEFIPLQHAKAAQMVQSLNALMGERVVEYIINPADGKRSKIEENRVAGLVLAADERTNAIVARGSRSKVDQVKATIAMLDVPADDDDGKGPRPPRVPGKPSRVIRTITLERQKPEAARAKLEQLYAQVAKERKPVIVGFDDTNRIAIAGDPALVDEGVQILHELEGDGTGPLDPDARRAITIFPLSNSAPEAMVQSIKAILNPRQVTSVTLLAGPDGRSLLVNALPDDTDAIRQLVTALDRPNVVEQQFRAIPIAGLDAKGLMEKAKLAFERLTQGDDPAKMPLPLVEHDATNGTLAVSGPRASVALYERALGEARTMVPAPRTTKLVALKQSKAEAIVEQLRGLVARALAADPARSGAAPTIEVVPATNSLQVIGDAQQLAIVDIYAAALDRGPNPVQPDLRAYRIERADPAAVARTLQDLAAKGALSAQPADGRPPVAVSVNVDPTSRSLIVAGDAMTFSRVEEMLKKLDASAATADVRLVPLSFVKAAEIKASLEAMVPTALAADGLAPPAFTAVDQVNAILIAASPRQHEIIAALLKGLDVERGSASPLRILQLRTADAVSLATTLTANFAKRSPEERIAKPVTVSADPQTNTLLVAAHPDTLGEIEKLVDELNGADRRDGDGREIRIFPLKVAQAAELAKTIDEMYPPPPVPVDPRGRARPELQKPREVVVRADPQTNALIVDAPIARMAGFEKLVEQLDRQQLAVDTEIRTFRVGKARLESLASTLRQLATSNQLGAAAGKSQVTVSTEAVSGTLVVSGPKEIFAKVDELMKGVGGGDMPSTALRTYRLEKAKAESMAPMLRQILAGRVKQDLPDAATELDRLLEVTADRRSNSLIVSAPISLVPLADELVKQLDTGTAAGDPIVRVRPLTFADANAVATSLTQALPAVVSKTTGEPMSVRVIAAGGANSLLLVGLAQDLDEVEKLIEPMDARPANDAVDAKTIQLKNADAAKIAPTVERLLNDQQETDPRIILERIRRSRGQADSAPKVRVEADARTNSLIVSGPQRVVALAETLVQQLDIADTSAERSFATFTPSHFAADRLAETARKILDATKPSGVRTTVELVPEPQSGALIVIGSKDEGARALTVLKQLDEGAASPPQMDVKLIAVAHSDAAVVASTIAPMLADRSRWPQPLVAAAKAGLPVGEPRVTADVASNRLLVSAPRELLPMVEEIVARLDVAREGGSSSDTRVFTLVNAEAADVARALQGAADGRAKSRPGEPKPTIAAEPSSNALVLTATPEQLAEFETLITRLDSGVRSDAVQVRTVYLKNARAEQIVTMVEKLLAPVPPQPGPRGRQQPVSTEPPVRVVADQRLNAVIVSASPSSLNVAEQMVTQLDQAPAQGQSRSVRVLTVENADAAELAKSLEDVFRDAGDSDVPPTVRVNASSNALIVRASDAQYATIEEVVKKLDRATVATNRQMKTIAIDPTKANAAEIARMLERLLQQRDGSAVEVVPVEELLKKYGGKDAPKKTSSRPMPLTGAIVAMAFAAVDPPSAPPSAPPAAQEPGVTIAVDEKTNSLIILGSPKSIERVRLLAEQAQRELPAEASTIRAITLPEGMDLERIRGLVEQTLSKMTPAGGKPGDLAKRVAILSDPASRALIVAASDQDFDVIGQLIATFAKSGTPDRVVVKSYRLQNVSAERAARGLRELLQPSGRDNRLKELSVTLDAGGKALDASFDPSQVRAIPDASSNAILVIAPSEALAFLDRFIELADQTPVAQATAVRIFPLRHAKAAELQTTLGGVFAARARGVSAQGAPAEFGVESRTNTLVVTAPAETLREVESLVAKLDQPSERDRRPLQILDLAAAEPKTAAELLTKTVIGDDQARRESTLILPDEGSGTLLVRADDATLAEIRTVLKEIDRSATSEFKVRSIVLDRADAGAVAQAIQRFYDDRAKIATGNRQRRDNARRISIVGDSRAATLLVAASDGDFEEIKQLVTQFDTAKAAQSLEFRVYPLEHARADEIAGTMQSLIGQLTWTESMRGGTQWGTRGQNAAVAVRAEARMNSLIVTGRGDSFALVDQLVAELDRPAKEGQRTTVRAYPVRIGELDAIAGLLKDALGVRDQRFGGDEGASRIRIVPVTSARTIVVSASEASQKEVATLLAGLEQSMSGPSQTTKVIPVEYASASEIASTLKQFLAERRGTAKGAMPTIMPSSNALVISATEEDLATIRDLLTKLDQPTTSGDRSVEILSLERGQAVEIARMIGEQFGKRGGAGSGVIVTPDARTNSLVVNAPSAQLEQVKALVVKLDGPTDAAETVIRTYALKGAKAEDVSRILGQTLQLDSKGRTSGISLKPDENSPPVQVVARIAPDRRSNSLVVTATLESFPVIESLIKKLEQVPAASPVEYRVLTLRHAIASDVASTLRRLVRDRNEPNEQPPSIDSNRLENQLVIGATSDQFTIIENILKTIDVPASRPRKTDFVTLKHAQAEKVQDALSYFYGRYAGEADTPDKQNVRIVADPASNSLVISAVESEWAGIRELLAKLDSDEYDAGLQLRVIPLVHADAAGVARAINEAFRGPTQARNAQPQRQGRGNEEPPPPTTLVRNEDWVSAAADAGTNALVVSASKVNLEKIEAIVKQIDIADFDRLPAPRLIPVRFGNPEQLAQAIDRIYAPPSSGAGGASRESQKSRLRIVADVSSNALIVRAPDDEYQQILAIADALQQQATEQGLNVHLLQLKQASAARVAQAIREAFTARAQQAKLPFSVQTDAAGNSLVIASTGPLFDEIKGIVEQMDSLAPGAGQAIFVIDLAHIAPDAAAKVIQQIGLDKPAPEGTTSKVVIEPVKVSAVPGRAAIIVVANPGDRETILGLVKAIDSEPKVAESQVRIVPLHNAKATALAKVMNDMLQPGEAPAGNALAKALQEQIRRLSLRRDGAGQPDLKLDLTQPVKILADDRMNALLVASTAENVVALEEIVKSFDQLPVTDAVMVSIYPLENISSQQFARILKELFTQGKQLGEIPGTKILGIPAGTAGKALLSEIVISSDDRTNTVIVAGSEDAVALVDVLRKKLDTDVGIGWVEPKILPLRYADAADLAKTLQSVLVEGSTKLPEASPMQKQIGRLRMARMGEKGGEVVEGDVFVAMGNLVIRPEPQLNALMVVGSRANVEIVEELIKQLDVEAASPASLVRIYPLQNASAARLATTVTSLFEAQRTAKTIRDEDRLRAIADERTNALIVSTSPRSFVVFEELLKTLDQKLAPEIKEIRTVEMKNASAARLAPMIQQLMDARLERLRKVQPETADLERATVVADGRINALIVAAGADTFGVIERLAQDLDREETSESGLLQVITVRKANLDRVASALNQIMERRYADLPNEVRRRVRPLVLTDPRTSSLLVSAGPDDIKAIEDLVTKLEATPANPAVGMEVIALDSVRAEEIAPKLQTLMRERQQSLGTQAQPSDAVAVTPDVSSNSLIIAASAENVAVVRNLVELLTKAAKEAIGGESLEIVQLAKSRAADIVAMIDEMYVREENRRRGVNTVKAAAEPRLNAVLLSGSQPDIDTMRRMVAQLDGAKPNSVVEIKYLPLASANVIETVNLIQTVLSGSSIAGGANSQQAIVLKYLRQIGGKVGATGAEGAVPADGPIEMEVSAAVRQSISLTPDIRTNTIIARAPKESMELIERMVKDLDGSSSGSQNIRVFKLVNADAEQMARILGELFSLKQRGNLYVLKPREQLPGEQPQQPGADGQLPPPAAAAQAPAQGNIGLFGTELTLVPDERQQLSITVDNRTNSLLVSGTPNYLDLVDKVVKELDAQEANSRDTLVYHLKNATATEVARVLTEFVQKDQQKVLSTLGTDQRPSAQKLLEQEVTIVGDEKSNSVLVNASPRYMEKVTSVIQELDVDPPQVLIQVLLAEITLDTSEELGLQFTRFGLGDVDIAGGYGLTRTNFTSNSPQVPGLTGLAPALFGAAVVPNIAIGNADFDLLLNALQSQNRVELLSNPSVMVANNTQGRIQVGDTVRLPSSVSFNSVGQQSAVTPEEVGVILQVTPSINPDGFVRMKIEPEISRISKDSTKISENFQSPIINRRRATTTVTVKDGQTVVIGGLIQDRFERIERKIPFLGDIPIIGPLFRNKSESASKTELLIVLTPHVVTNPKAIDNQSESALGKATLPAEIIDQIRRGELNGVRGTIDEDGRMVDPIKSKPKEPKKPAADGTKREGGS